MRLTTVLAAVCAAALSTAAFAQEAVTSAPAQATETPAQTAAQPQASAPSAEGAATAASAENVKVGVEVTDRDGAALGVVEQPVLDASGVLASVSIKDAGGAVYALPAGGFQARDGKLVAGWTKAEIDQARAAQAPAAAAAQPQG